MAAMEPLGRVLFFVGVLLVVLGVVFMLGKHIPFLGKLPGDFSFERKGLYVIVPLGTSLAISIVLTLLLNLIFRR